MVIEMGMLFKKNRRSGNENVIFEKLQSQNGKEIGMCILRFFETLNWTMLMTQAHMPAAADDLARMNSGSNSLSSK